jgi:hypothetical protein
MSSIIINDVSVYSIDSSPDHDKICVSVAGNVPTSGWTSARLSPWVYFVENGDGYWDMDLIITPPYGIVLEVVLPFSAQGIFYKPKGFKGVRIHTQDNSSIVEKELSTGNSGPVKLFDTPQPIYLVGKTIVSQQIAQYDDSFQPTGTIHWKNDGPFGLPNPHVEMKKLSHSIVITVEGIDEESIRSCLNKAFTNAALASILAAFISGGMAAASAFLSVGIQSLKDCLSDNALDVKITDDSHWVYWDV